MTDPLGIHARRAGSNAHRYGEDERGNCGGEDTEDADGCPEVESSAADHVARCCPLVVLHALAIGEYGEEHLIALALAGPLRLVGSEKWGGLALKKRYLLYLLSNFPRSQAYYLNCSVFRETGWIRVKLGPYLPN